MTQHDLHTAEGGTGQSSRVPSPRRAMESRKRTLETEEKEILSTINALLQQGNTPPEFYYKRLKDIGADLVSLCVAEAAMAEETKRAEMAEQTKGMESAEQTKRLELEIKRAEIAAEQLKLQMMQASTAKGSQVTARDISVFGIKFSICSFPRSKLGEFMDCLEIDKGQLGSCP